MSHARRVIRHVNMAVMRLPTLRRARSVDPDAITGVARLDRRTKRLTGRLRPGDIAVIDHVDIDRVAADALVAVGVAAVLNAKPSISGRYPNLGPQVLIKNGVLLVDNLGEEVFARLHEGDTISIDNDTVMVDGQAVAVGVRQDAETVPPRWPTPARACRCSSRRSPRTPWTT